MLSSTANLFLFTPFHAPAYIELHYLQSSKMDQLIDRDDGNVLSLGTFEDREITDEVCQNYGRP